MLPAKFAILLPCVLATLVSPAILRASVSPELVHQLDEIFNKGAYRTESVDFAWLEKGNSYSALEPASDGKGTDLVVYETSSGKRTVAVSSGDLMPQSSNHAIEIQGYNWSKDGKKVLIFTDGQRVWRANTRGNYWVFDRGASDPQRRLIKIGGNSPASSLMYAEFAPDGTRVAYVRANNLYVQDLNSGAVAQLTGDGSPDVINATSDWVNEEELDLRNCFRWSPDGKYIAYWQFDQSMVGEYTLINDTESRYPIIERYKYPQAGTTNSTVRIGIVPAEGGATRWVKLDGGASNHYVPQLEWEPESHHLLIEYLDRLQKKNQYILASAENTETRVVFEDTDGAWVDESPIGWIKKEKHAAEYGSDMLVQSERDGWRHIYRVDLLTNRVTRITNFTGDVIERVGLDEERGWLYFTASPDDPLRKYLYRCRADGTGTTKRVTPSDEPGTHVLFMAPNGRWAFQFVDSADIPPRADLLDLSGYHVLRAVLENKKLSARIAPLLSSTTEFFKVKIEGDLILDGWMIKPPDFDPQKKYPVLFWVYGEPWFSTSRDQWFFDERLFHGLIAKEGYLVVTIDNSGTSSPRGREWRKSIHGALGVVSSAQISEAMRTVAAERPYIDTARMAIWGWSGGGSNTLNLMFRYPELFSTGIAFAPVPDLAGYDSIYQERYMGLPEENKQGYHDGSPINFAAGLKGHLLLIHGSGDDNVHFQGTEQLVNKLIELGKSFDFIDYPGRSHGLFEGMGTSMHLRMLIVRYLEDHVPPGGVTR